MRYLSKMKLVEIYNGLDGVSPKKVNEQNLGYTSERLYDEIEKLKDIINNGKKICGLYFKHLKSMNFGVVNTHIKNFDYMLENLKGTQSVYNKRWEEYFDLLEEFEKDGNSINGLRRFSKLVDELDDIQIDMDNIYYIMSDVVDIVKRGKIEDLNKKYDIKQK